MRSRASCGEATETERADENCETWIDSFPNKSVQESAPISQTATSTPRLEAEAAELRRESSTLCATPSPLRNMPPKLI